MTSGLGALLLFSCLTTFPCSKIASRILSPSELEVPVAAAGGGVAAAGAGLAAGFPPAGASTPVKSLYCFLNANS